MRFKLDENLPDGLTTDLQAHGDDAETCGQEGIGGADDPAILAHCTAESRILLTCDLDFSDIRRYPPGSHAGIVIFRLHTLDVTSLRQALARLLGQVTETDLSGNLVIVEDLRLRIRRAGSAP
jgi:predicted nuclease of predicted toxin-antitoxin system